MLFSSTKWEILSLIAKQPKSPLEIAEILNTSMANISQQLRLLEFAGLVKSERVPNREKGKPRKLYSLINEVAYLVVLSKGRQEKKLIPLTESSKQKLIALLEGKK